MNASTRAKLSALSLFVGAWLVSGCEDQAFCLDCQEVQSAIDADASLADASSGDTGSLVDAGLDAVIIPDANSAETSTDACNADTQNDPLNCGACGNACLLANAFPSCNEGKCEIESCASGYHDLDQDPANGCEYGCNPSNGGVEACDSKDNDCDGEIDEDFDLQSDVNNCGACGNACDLDHATAKCELVNGTPQCVIDTCHDGFADVDDSDVDGCEYACPVNPPTAEVCNELDDDCDGAVDEDFGLGESCAGTGGPGSPCGEGVRECDVISAQPICSTHPGGSQYPGVAETCNAADDDCDGEVDEDLGTTLCGVGACQHELSACVDGAPPACDPRLGAAPEILDNGVDEDCDGLTDDNPCTGSERYWEGNGHCYWNNNSSSNWNAAKNACTNAGGYLVTIGSAAENSFVDDELLGRSNRWIGLSDTASEDHFVWVDGSPLTYTNWVEGEPNDWGTGEDCAAIYGSDAGDLAGQWNDTACSGNLRSICEADRVH